MKIFSYKKTLLIGLFCIIFLFFPGQTNGQNSNTSSASVDLVWESLDSQTPSFYKGKTLHPGWGEVRVSAIAHVYRDGERINQQNLIYTWKYNGLVYGDDSGRGETSFTVSTVPRDGNRVTVEVETVGGERVASQSVLLPITDPEVFLYRQDPLLGTMTNRALGKEYTLTNSDEITIEAQPYFFLAHPQQDRGLSYDWRMNGATIEPSGGESAVTLRRQGNTGGEASVRIEIEDEHRLFPSAQNSIDIIF